MSGVAGKSGRKGFHDEVMVSKIMKSANIIILKTLKGEGKYANTSTELKIEVAARFAIKGVPQIVDIETSERKYVQIVHEIEGLDPEALRGLSGSCRQRALPEVSSGVSGVGEAVHKD